MKHVVYILSIFLTVVSLSSCVIAPVYPGQRTVVATSPNGYYYYGGHYYHHRVWVRGHYTSNRVWIPGHWVYYY